MAVKTIYKTALSPYFFIIFSLTALLTFTACGSSQPSANSGSPVEQGEALFQNTGGMLTPNCITCHVLDPNGDSTSGPVAHGWATLAEERLASPDYTGSATTAAEYLRESIVNPDVYIVGDYVPGVMYQQYGSELSAEQLDALVAYMLTLNP